MFPEILLLFEAGGLVIIVFLSVFYISLRISPICCNISEKRKLFFFLLKSIGPQWAKLNRCADQVQIDVQIDGEIKPNRRAVVVLLV